MPAIIKCSHFLRHWFTIAGKAEFSRLTKVLCRVGIGRLSENGETLDVDCGDLTIAQLTLMDVLREKGTRKFRCLNNPHHPIQDIRRFITYH